jgi:Putative adhesin
MKKLFFPLLAGLGIICCSRSDVRAQKQEFKQHISKEFTLQKGVGGVLALYNLNGSLNVEGYSGDKVLIEVDERLTADDNADLEVGKKEFKLGFDTTADSIIVYIAEPFDTRPCYDCDRWERRRHDGDRPEIPYDFDLAFTVKVPYHMNLDISTVNKGDITVESVSGSMHVNNVNGKITIKDAKGETRAHTINGDLTVNYLEVPTGNSEFYTLNGRLSVTFPQSLSADLQFKSWNGSFYTDFPKWEVLPAKVTKSVQNREGGTEYQLIIDKQIRIGEGGRLFKFETMNGNIYIKRQA